MATPARGADFERKVLEGIGEIKGRVNAVEDQIQHVIERADRSVQSSADNAAALKTQDERLQRLENRTAENLATANNGYRELSYLVDGLKTQVDRLAEDARAAAPAVADDVATRVDEHQESLHKSLKVGVKAAVGVGAGGIGLGIINIAINHPAAVKAALTGVKNLLDATLG